MTRPVRNLTAAFVVVVAAFPLAAAAAPPRPQAPTHTRAVELLHRAEDLREGTGVRTGRELTFALAQLYRALPRLTGSDRAAAVALLARPTDTPDPQGTHSWSGPEATPKSPYCALGNFCIHWTAVGKDAPVDVASPSTMVAGVPDSVVKMAQILANEVYPCENGTGSTACAGAPGMNWRPPAPDGSLGGSPQLDIYVEDLYSHGLYGYVATDPGQPQDPSVPHHAYMVMDRDFSQFAGGNPAGGLAAERVTAAHEYNHVLQNAYDYREDVWMFEATAVYMENVVYPAIHDYLTYVSRWAALTDVPLTRYNPNDAKVYGDAVWNQWLDARYGAGIVRSAWEKSVAAGDFAPDAYSAAISAAGGSGFSDEFERFAAAVAEWNVAGSGFPDAGRYPDLPRPQALVPGLAAQSFSLAHTTFRFFNVPVPASGPPFLRFTATLPSGVRGAVALVGRTGPDPKAGAVTTRLTSIPSGGSGAVQLEDPGNYGRMTAVVVNSDASRAGFDPASQDWAWTRDATGVTAVLTQPDHPVTTTGFATGATDHAVTVAGSVDPQGLDSVWLVEYGKTAAYGSATALQPAIPASSIGPAPVSLTLSGLKANATYHYRFVATNSIGVAPGADRTFVTARDHTPPGLALTVPGREKLRKLRTYGLRLIATCTEACHGTVRLRIGGADARRLRLATTLGSVELRSQAGTASSLRLRPARAQSRRLAGVKRLRAKLVVTVADEYGNSRTVTRLVSLTR